MDKNMLKYKENKEKHAKTIEIKMKEKWRKTEK